jgi:PDZ domain-containing protein
MKGPLSRHNTAALLALALVVGLAVVAARKPVPYVTFAPGPTVNVLSKFDGKDIITVSGHPYYRDKGALRLTTVVPSGPDEKVSIPALVFAWIDPDRAVYPYRSLYGSNDTQKSVRQQGTAEMTSSQDAAIAAALGALKVPYDTEVGVASVDAGGPAAGKLEPGDVITAVDGKAVSGIEQVTGAIRPLMIGSSVAVTVRRKGTEKTVRMTTTAAADDPTKSAVKVAIAVADYKFPFKVKVNLDANIGGPSGGLMFATAIYDLLTPGSLTGGKAIAGTGEIDGTGQVGAIGGIQQKLVGAQSDGAKLFLVPASNCAEALGGHYDPDKMRLVKVSTLSEAIEDVKAWAKDPGASLPRCTR